MEFLETVFEEVETVGRVSEANIELLDSYIKGELTSGWSYCVAENKG